MKTLFLVSGMDAGAAKRVASILVGVCAQRGNFVWLVPTFSGRGNVFYKLFAAL
jgi:GalNAc-alpha-(1->4)-GalNAc-alpha-(1->3)-diNAcBac-PP-undecaprenol alpha-1,4-N-acetyl-D-galactosaminyltransferase